MPAAAAPSFRASGGFTNNIGAITATAPTHVADDILIYFIETAAQAVSATNFTNAGWTELTTVAGSTGTAGNTLATQLTAYWKRATSGAETMPQVTDTGDHQGVVCISISGCILTGSPFDVANRTIQASATATVTCPSVTVTTTDDTLVVFLATNTSDSNVNQQTGTWTNAGLSNITNRVATQSNAGGGSGLYIGTGTKTGSGATGTTGATTFFSTTTISIWATMVLKPEPIVTKYYFCT